MDLEKERELNYKINIVRDEQEFQLLIVEFEAVDYSKIHAEIVVKKVNNKGFILEFPDYEEVPRGFLGLMNYYALGYSGATLHVRGDRGRSENNQPASIYFPFLNNNSDEELYYNYAYQDGIDLVNILKREFPNLEVNVVAKGQGAAIGIVVSAVGKLVDRLFISNVQNFDFKYIFDNNLDVGVYDGIREYARNYPEREDYLLMRLREIDVLKYGERVDAKVYFGYSNLDENNIILNKKLESVFKRKEVTVFECEEENLHVKLLEKWLKNSMELNVDK
ncbi:acetylxylan esterase [Gemella haemolysans]|uniref:Acetyl xylan esterase (AXE1) n=1 Tax=Gemella haemolysans ATCC 10379 TaxID=546270 RepID=C5NVR8_9BACL|nr:acetylxylan esterase [Gemella haemolysans]EER68768.1 acetyl xylan esterase (AXE1) [Gemella haemolysans ATCC 10379]KAA8708393.1 acetylxylan esterase [Gemella haemolysans]UBH82307.1 acetylxylan esterase [Gemella haemolysans]